MAKPIGSPRTLEVSTLFYLNGCGVLLFAWVRLPYLMKRGWGYLSPIPSYFKAGTMGATEDYPRTVSHPTPGTNSPATGASSSPTTTLHDGPHMSNLPAAASISNIRSFIHSSFWIATAKNLRGREAQGFIDFIDQVSGV